MIIVQHTHKPGITLRSGQIMAVEGEPEAGKTAFAWHLLRGALAMSMPGPFKVHSLGSYEAACIIDAEHRLNQFVRIHNEWIGGPNDALSLWVHQAFAPIGSRIYDVVEQRSEFIVRASERHLRLLIVDGADVLALTDYESEFCRLQAAAAAGDFAIVLTSYSSQHRPYPAFNAFLRRYADVAMKLVPGWYTRYVDRCLAANVRRDLPEGITIDEGGRDDTR
jgi:hypothetical protein